MKIKKLTATFGNLDRAVLEPTDGINVYTMPNESGKTTWASFIIAMFYGIDSSGRDTATRLADKNRFRPWNGAPAAGVMELLLNGEPVTIERFSTGKSIFNVFSAKNTLTGEPIPGLTGDNCGQTLLGVSRGVFERSAFVRQSGAAFDHDNDLEKKLVSLVTTGEEGVSYSEAEGKLRQSLRRIKYNKTGEIPDLENELAGTLSKLDKLKVYNQKNVEQSGRIERLTIDKAQCEQQLREVIRFEDSQALKRVREADNRMEELLKRQAEILAGLESVPKMPAAKEIGAMLRGLDVLDELEKNVEDECKQLLAPRAIPEHDTPPVFEGLSKEGAAAKAKEDANAGKRFVSQSKIHKLLPPILALIAAVALIAGIVVSISGQTKYGIPVCIAAGVIGALAAAYYFTLAKSGGQKAKDGLDKLLEAYNTESVEGIDAALRDYLAHLAKVETLADVTETSKKRAVQIRADLVGKRGELFKLIETVAPDYTEVEAAREELERLLELVSELESAKSQTASAKEVKQALEPSIADVRLDDEDLLNAKDPGHDKRAIQESLTRITRELNILSSANAMSKGEAKAIGDPAALAAQKLSMENRIEALSHEYRAIEIALVALKKANADLQNRFSPAINDRAGEIMARLTGNRYIGVVFDRSMGITAMSVDDILSHDTRSLSTGTVDQLYLAVRLAICDLALPTDSAVPLIFDDAFSNFDDERLERVLRWLKLESDWRQTIIFSCHDREEKMLASLE